MEKKVKSPVAAESARVLGQGFFNRGQRVMAGQRSQQQPSAYRRLLHRLGTAVVVQNTADKSMLVDPDPGSAAVGIGGAQVERCLFSVNSRWYARNPPDRLIPVEQNPVRGGVMGRA